MKKILLSFLLVFSAQYMLPQTTPKTYELLAVAEGNFGTPNGDIFTVGTHATGTLEVNAKIYQNANNTTGFDVLQDFQIIGNKAVLLSKAAGFRVVIADYPSLNHIATLTGLGGPQTLAAAGTAKAYLSSSNPNAIYSIDLTNNMATAVVDPNAVINGTASYMVYADGYIYAAMSSKIVKIDVATNTVAAVIQPNAGTVAGLQYDAANNIIWILGKVSGTSALIKMQSNGANELAAPVTLTGITNATQLRLGNHKLYFLSGKNVHTYDATVPGTTVTFVYTSTLTGTWDFAYGKSFDVDAESGDFVIGSASAFTSGSKYEIVNGTDFTLIEAGSIDGCMGVNEFMLKTFEGTLSVQNPTANEIVQAIYPNPVRNILNIELKSDNNAIYSVALISQLGVTVKNTTGITNGQCKIDVSGLSAGIYIVRITDTVTNATTVRKVIVS